MPEEAPTGARGKGTAGDALPFVPSEVLGAMSLRQVKSFKPTEGQEPSARLTDGGVYFGDLDDHRRPHGRGIAILGDGVSRYGGDWQEGHYHGFGSMCASTFDFEGSWDTDEMHGFGTIYYKDTVVSILLRGVQLLSPFDATHKPLEYRGDFHKTYHRHGKGTMTYRNGDVYEGSWNANRREGMGTMRYASGERFQGHWKSDERHGEGVLQFANGSVFKGTFEHDKRHGDRCTFTLTSGDEYFGAFHNDDITGSGTMRYKNGDVYEGMWRDGVRHGKGKFELKKRGATIEGTFVRGLIDGEATVTFPGKSKYIGLFEKGEKVHGTMFNDVDGTCYQGEWRSDHMHGVGLQWCGNGDFYYGKFANSKREGFGNCTYVDGDEYSGEFLNGVRHGRGVLQRGDGSILAGMWENDTFVSGYQGEWDGAHFNGVGTLQLEGNSSYFGIFRDGMRDGLGVMKIAKSRCNAAAIAALEDVPVWRRVVGPGGEAILVPPHERNGVTDIGMVVYGKWKKDELNGPSYIRYPGGETFTGTSLRGVRHTETHPSDLFGGSGAVQLTGPYGHEFVGTMRSDGQDGATCYYLAKDLSKPLYDPMSKEEEAMELAMEVERCRSEADAQQKRNAAKESSGFFDSLMHPLSMFRRGSEDASAGNKSEFHRVPRRIVDYENDFIVVGPWIAADRDEQLLVHIAGVQPSKSVPLLGGGKGAESLRKSTPPYTGTLPPSIARYASGTACGASTFFFLREQSIFQVELCENRPVLFVPHKTTLSVDPIPPPSFLVVNGELQTRLRSSSSAANADPVLHSSSSSDICASTSDPRSCMHCQKEFGLFRKPIPCEVCRLNKCASCLTEVNPVSYDKDGLLMSFLAARHFKKEGSLCNTLPFNMRSRLSICPWCASAVSLALAFGTYWRPLPGAAAAAEGDAKHAGTAVDAVDLAASEESKQPDAPEATAVVETPAQSSSSHEWLVYRGPVSSNKPHGNGALWYGTVAYYRGCFVHGARQGHGMQVFPNGESYVGQWHNDERSGVGRYHCSDGSTLIGQWRNGLLQDVSYHGDVDASGARCGRGQSFESDGSRFNGQWVKNKRHGSGILQSTTGDIYSGSFEDNLFHGVGKLVHSASVFMGNFVGGVKHGYGVERFGDRIVVGQWMQNALQGLVRVHDTSKEDVYDTLYTANEERTDMFLPQPMEAEGNVTMCFHCHAEFGFFLRKHHCRMCARVFCDNCTKQRAVLPKHYRTDGPQRLCDGCFDALQVGQSLGIRRYASGAVYCGLWAGGVWSSSGLYRRPTGEFYLLNSHRGDSVSAIATPRDGYPPVGGFPSCGANESTEVGPDNTVCETGPHRTEEDHRHLPANGSLPKASEEDIEKFKAWWATMLDAVLPGGSELFPLTFDRADTIEPPKWNPSVELNLFSLKDDEDETAAARRQSFARQSIPTMPPPPLGVKPLLSTFDRSLPIADDSVQLEAITNERIERFMPFPPPTPLRKEQDAPDELPQSATAPPEADFYEVSSSDLHRTLRCFAKKKLNLDTPVRPPHHTNINVPWNAWSCYPVPEYRGTAGTFNEPYMKSLPMVTVPDCYRRQIVVAPLDGPQSFRLQSSRSGVMVVVQSQDG